MCLFHSPVSVDSQYELESQHRCRSNNPHISTLMDSTCGDASSNEMDYLVQQGWLSMGGGPRLLEASQRCLMAGRCTWQMCGSLTLRVAAGSRCVGTTDCLRCPAVLTYKCSSLHNLRHRKDVGEHATFSCRVLCNCMAWHCCRQQHHSVHQTFPLASN